MRKKILNINTLMFLFVFINLLVGFFIYEDFGITTDEPIETINAEIALQAFSFKDWEEIPQLYVRAGNVRFYGTAATLSSLLFAKVFAPLLGQPEEIAIHLAYFIFFQLGVVSLYYLAKNFVKDIYAFVAAVLFATQPLLFGHAFMNPKDIPFLAAFLAAMAIGVGMVRKIFEHVQPEKKFWQGLLNNLKADWKSLTGKQRKWLGGTFLYWPLLPGIVYLVRWLAGVVISAAYYGDPDRFLTRWFLQHASNIGQVGLESYISKAQNLAGRGILVVSLLVFVFHLFFFIRFFTASRTKLVDEMVRPYFDLPKDQFRKLLAFVVFGGISWGFASSVRIGGLVAGGMVGLYLLLRLREKAILPAIVYTLAAGLTTFLIWPYLWFFRFRGFIQAIKTFSRFDWHGRVFFHGELYTAYNLPKTFLVELIGVQFTAPVIVLCLVGMAIAGVWIIQKKINWPLGFILFSWLLLPIVYSFTGRMVFYGNFRQYFFIVPPLFVFAGIALQWIGEKIRTKALMIVLSVAILLPGLYFMVSQHPYEYVYYNCFTGGLHGAYQTYEMDYWNTAYKEGMRYINENAPEGATVLVWRVPFIAEFYQREDLEIVFQSEIENVSIKEFDYALIQNVLKIRENNLREEAVVHTIELNDIPLLYIMDMEIIR